MTYFKSDKGVHYTYCNGMFDFFYKNIALFGLSDILINKSWEDGTGTLDLDAGRLKIGVDEY